jgi:hypothetical protein
MQPVVTKQKQPTPAEINEIVARAKQYYRDAVGRDLTPHEDEAFNTRQKELRLKPGKFRDAVELFMEVDKRLSNPEDSPLGHEHDQRMDLGNRTNAGRHLAWTAWTYDGRVPQGDDPAELDIFFRPSDPTAREALAEPGMHMYKRPFTLAYLEQPFRDEPRKRGR